MSMLTVMGDASNVIAMFEEHRVAADRCLRMLAKLDSEYPHGLFAVLAEMETAWGIKVNRALTSIPGAVTHVLYGASTALVGVVPRSPTGDAVPPPFAGDTEFGRAVAATLNEPRRELEIPLFVFAEKGGAIGGVRVKIL